MSPSNIVDAMTRSCREDRHRCSSQRAARCRDDRTARNCRSNGGPSRPPARVNHDLVTLTR